MVTAQRCSVVASWKSLEHDSPSVENVWWIFKLIDFKWRFDTWGKARLLVVVDVRVSAYAVLEADVQIIPEAAVQHHVSHHPNPVFNLEGGNGETGLKWIVIIKKCKLVNEGKNVLTVENSHSE